MKTWPTKKLLKEDLESRLYNRSGYLPNQYIDMLSHLGIVRAENAIEDWQFQPVSLDLRLGPKAYRIQSSFLPENDTVEAKLKDVKLYEFDLMGGGVLEKGAVYLIPLMEELAFPHNICGRTNPKSSTGRLDMFTRVIVDKGHRFDEIPNGYKGKMYLEIISRTFPIRVHAGLSLNQLRIFKGVSGISDRQLRVKYKKDTMLYNSQGFPVPLEQVKVDGGLFIGVDIAGDSSQQTIAYKAKHNSHVVDLSKIRHYHAEDFWEPIYPQKKNRLILEPESFYIMMSKQKICIWPHLLAEMVAYEPNSGELRTHYAGFFDPGFGWHGNDALRQGTHAVMEVRPHDVPFMVEDGQTFCRLKFEKVIEKPTKVYGMELKSHYQTQGLALSKYFKS